VTTPILVAGIGNVFLGDDGFGVEVVRRLRAREEHPDVRVVDFGIRGLDLAYALLEPWSAVVFVDAIARGGKPGTLYLIEPVIGDTASEAHAGGHGMDPARALAAARQMGGNVGVVRLVGCEPESVVSDAEELTYGLSEPVAQAVAPAVSMVDELIESFREARRA
jgi:hydrogenase maturation protease